MYDNLVGCCRTGENAKRLTDLLPAAVCHITTDASACEVEAAVVEAVVEAAVEAEA